MKASKGMKVILLRDLKASGRRGEVVDVKPGHARNYLIPQGLAVEATPQNQRWFEEQRVKIEARVAKEREAATRVAESLAGVGLTLAKRADEAETLYGSVTAAEIVEALAEKGFDIDRKQVDLEGGIKTLGEHHVRIELHPEVIVEIPLTVTLLE